MHMLLPKQHNDSSCQHWQQKTSTTVLCEAQLPEQVMQQWLP